MILPTTSGAPSWPRSTPVENVQATFRFLTLSRLIWSSLLYRWLVSFPVSSTHCSGFADCCSTSSLAIAGVANAYAASDALASACLCIALLPTAVGYFEAVAIVGKVAHANRRLFFRNDWLQLKFVGAFREFASRIFVAHRRSQRCIATTNESIAAVVCSSISQRTEVPSH